MTSRPPFYSVNDNQNYFVSTGKTSSRVLQAPGGSSSLSLGWSAATTSNNSKISFQNYLWAAVNLNSFS